MPTRAAESAFTPAALPDEVDVVVVGSGAGALAGALTAAKDGMRVAILEKTALVGGISAYSGAAVWLPGNHVLARDGIEDSVEAGLTFFRACVGDRTPAALQEAYVRTGPELLAFLESDPDIGFAHHPFPDYYEAPGRCVPKGRTIRPLPIDVAELGDLARLLRPTSGPDKFDPGAPRVEAAVLDQFAQPVHTDPLGGGQALIGRLLLALSKTGNVEVHTGVPMGELAVEDGRVVGVRIGAGDHAGALVRARAGVLVAAGGFECNAERRQRHQSLGGAVFTASPVGTNTGDALAAFEGLGAEIDLLDESWWCASLLMPNGHAGFIPIVQRGIFVGADGRRFADEALPYDQLGRQFRAQIEKYGTDSEFWWVFDSTTDNVPGIATPMPDVESHRAAGLWRSGRDLDELAHSIGVPAEVLRETIATYNSYAETGVDVDFGRGNDAYDLFFSVGDGPNPALVPLVDGPFHAVRVVLGDLGTKGGARIGTSGEVLDRSGQPVPGLFAAGGSAASVAGHVYPGPGVPLGSGMVFGYRAAKAMQAAVAAQS